MKKTILTLMAAMVMMLSLGVTASAVTSTGKIENGASIPVSFASTGGTSPKETFYLVWVNTSDSTFSIDGGVYTNSGKYSGSTLVPNSKYDGCVPDLVTTRVDGVGDFVVASKELGGSSGTSEGYFEFDLPDFKNVGTYTYQLTEVKGNTAGVTYMSGTIYMKVYVSRKTDNSTDPATDELVVSKVLFYNEDGDKIQSVTNSYGAGSLTVAKEVAGIIGDGTEEFTVTVTFSSKDVETENVKTVKSTISYTDGTEQTVDQSAWTEDGNAEVKITLKNEEKVTFTNIPDGVTYTVAEEDVTLKDYKTPVYTYSDQEETKVINTSVEDTVTIKNEKKITVDTGISLDSLPYILMLLVSVVGLGILFSGKRLHG